MCDMKRYFIDYTLVDKALQCTDDIRYSLFSGDLFDNHGFFYKSNYNTDLRELQDLAAENGAIIVAESGMGKSHQMKILFQQFDDTETCFIQLADYENDPQGLSRDITQLNSTIIKQVLIDGLDEVTALIPVLSRSLKMLKICPNIFIASRNIPQLKVFINEFNLSVFALLPLSRENVCTLAREQKCDDKDFIETIIRLGLGSICSKPLGCKLLLSAYLQDSLTGIGSDELWRKGIIQLCEENDSSSRQLLGRTTTNAHICFDYVAKIAVVLKLSGKNIIWNGYTTQCPETCVDFSALFNEGFSENTFKEILGRGIFIPAGADRFRFSHTMYSDYLSAAGVYKFIDRRHWENIILSPDKAAVYPQWSGTAAWLSTFDAQWRELIFSIHPELLLVSDIIIQTIGQGKICHALIKRSNTLDHWSRRSSTICARLYTLKSLESREILKNVLENPSTFQEREMAIEIIRECQDLELEDYLVNIFCDLKESNRFRSSTGYALKDFASKQARIKCKEVLTQPDVSLNLKGMIFSLCWPELISIQEIAPHLVCEDRHTIDAYDMWITHDFPESLDKLSFDYCSELLQWAVKNIARNNDYRDPLLDLKRQIYTHCWKKFNDSTIYELLANGFLGFLKIHQYPFADSSIHGTPLNLIFENHDFEKDMTKRYIIADYLINKENIAGGELTLHSCQLINILDIEHVFKRIENTTTDDIIARKWARCLKRLQYGIRLPDLSTRWDALYCRFPDILMQNSDSVSLARQQEELENISSSSIHQKKREERQKERRKQRQASIDCVKNCLRNGTVSGHFDNIIHFFISETKSSQIDYREADIWHEFDVEEIKQLALGARDFLLKASMPQVTSNNIYPVFSRAFFILYTENKIEFQALPKVVWEKCGPELFKYSTFDHKNILAPIFEYLSQNFPEISLKELANKIRSDALNGYTLAAEKFMHLLTGKQVRELCAICNEKKLNAHQRSLILDSIYKLNPEAIREYLYDKYISKRYPIRKYNSRILLLIADQYPQMVDNIVRTAIVDVSWGRNWLESIINLDHYEHPLCPIFERSSLQTLANFYIWLNKNYPASNEPTHEGAYSPSKIDNIYDFKRKLFNTIADCKEIGVVSSLQEIYRHFPEDCWLLECIIKAKREELKLINPQFDMETIKILLTQKTNRILITSPQGLLETINNCLMDYQTYLTGKRSPMVEALWNKGKNSISPKSEEDFSDNILNYLQLRLVSTGIIINREVQLNRGRNGEAGSRTDIWIDTCSPDKSNKISLCIEVKGSWNPSATTALKTQLVEKYMSDGAADVGIFLVGWFDSKKYPQKKNLWKNDRIRALTELESQAEQEQLKGHCVCARIINCDYKS